MTYYNDFKTGQVVENLNRMIRREKERESMVAVMEEARETIQQLRAVLSGLRWIPVTERVPEHGDFVLVVVSGFPADSISLENAIEIGSWCDDTGEWFLDAWPEWERPKVTHWMELPCGPEIREEIQNDN